MCSSSVISIVIQSSSFHVIRAGSWPIQESCQEAYHLVSLLFSSIKPADCSLKTIILTTHLFLAMKFPLLIFGIQCNLGGGCFAQDRSQSQRFSFLLSEGSIVTVTAKTWHYWIEHITCQELFKAAKRSSNKVLTPETT